MTMFFIMQVYTNPVTSSIWDPHSVSVSFSHTP